MTRTATLHRSSNGRGVVLRVLLALMMLGPAWAGGTARLRTHRATTAAAPELTWTSDQGAPRQATLRQSDLTPLPAIKPKRGDFRAFWKIPAPGAAVIPESVSAADALLPFETPASVPRCASRRLLSPRAPRAPPRA